MHAVQERLIHVTLDPAGRPARFRWEERLYRVCAVLDTWRFGGRWWSGESPRECYLVQAGTLLAELHHEDAPTGRWWLARVQD